MVEEDYKNNPISFLTLSILNGVGFFTLKKIAKSNISFYNILKSESYIEFHDKLKQYGSLKSSLGQPGNWEEYRKTIWRQGAALYHELLSQNIKIIFDYDDEFPNSLLTVNDPPKWLFVQGNADILKSKSIAIVGTRNPSEDGLFITKYICLLIQKFGAVTVSGLATGIDQAVHNHSIQLNIPTIAVLGTGILSNYPAGSDVLRNKILNGGGTIITEYLPNEKYSAKNFVNRNRLQAGLANIVMPVEWKVKSGTAHTFNYAIKFNKHLICFRVTTWNGHEELEYAKSKGVSIFTIPGDEEKLIETVNHFQENIKTNELQHQLSLFEE